MALRLFSQSDSGAVVGSRSAELLLATHIYMYPYLNHSALYELRLDTSYDSECVRVASRLCALRLMLIEASLATSSIN